MVRVLCAEHAVKYSNANALLTNAWGSTLHFFLSLLAARPALIGCECDPNMANICHIDTLNVIISHWKIYFRKGEMCCKCRAWKPHSHTIQNMFDIKFINILIIVRSAGNEVCDTMHCPATAVRTTHMQQRCNDDFIQYLFQQALNMFMGWTALDWTLVHRITPNKQHSLRV